MKYDAICQKDHLLVVFFMAEQILDLKFILYFTNIYNQKILKSSALLYSFICNKDCKQVTRSHKTGFDIHKCQKHMSFKNNSFIVAATLIIRSIKTNS